MNWLSAGAPFEVPVGGQWPTRSSTPEKHTFKKVVNTRMKTLRLWWPYKGFALIVVFFLGGANSIMEVDTVAEFVGSPDLVYTHGIRASVYAVVAAAALFITRLPKNGVPQDEALDDLCGLVSVLAAFLTGIFWVLDETGGNIGPYFLVLFTVTGILTGGLAVFFVVQLVSERINKDGVALDTGTSRTNKGGKWNVSVRIVTT